MNEGRKGKKNKNRKTDTKEGKGKKKKTVLSGQKNRKEEGRTIYCENLFPVSSVLNLLEYQGVSSTPG